jgi:hypothetical protein
MDPQLQNAIDAEEVLQDVVESLLSIIVGIARENPRALLQTDGNGQTALQIACDHSKKASVVEDLVRLYLATLNGSRETYTVIPLLYTLPRNDLSLDVCESILDACPPDGVIDNPFHHFSTTVLNFACDHNTSAEVLRMLLTQYPDAIRFKDDECNGGELHFTLLSAVEKYLSRPLSY